MGVVFGLEKVFRILSGPRPPNLAPGPPKSARNEYKSYLRKRDT